MGGRSLDEFGGYTVVLPDQTKASSMPVVVWKRGESSAIFIEKLSAENAGSAVRLELYDALVDSYSQLQGPELEAVDNALKAAPIKIVEMNLYDRISAEHLVALNKIMGCMQPEAKIEFGLLTTIREDVAILQNIPSFFQEFGFNFGDDIDSEANNASAQTRQELAAAFDRFNDLKRIEFYIPIDYHSVLLPVLYTKQALLKVHFKGNLFENEVTPDAAHAVAGLLRTGESNPQLEIKVSGWNFVTQESQTIFCKAIAETRIYGLDFWWGTMLDPALLATSLANSELKKLTFAHMKFDGHHFADFINELALHISDMALLGSFEIGQSHFLTSEFGSSNVRDAAKRAFEEAVVNIIAALAECQQLKRLSIFLDTQHPNLDIALAACVASKTCQLDEIHLRSSHSNCEVAKLTELPELFEALKKNYTIQHIRLDGRWKHELKESLEIFPALNRAGRRPVDEMNKNTEIAVLGAVSNNLNCLMHHLSEAPTLFKREE
ncbi:hypothetical protein MPSEU_001012000 [Mayamaea pseudoterrestris]|nr:hypothetical protein MPSEU_001012000 [Mayamaea pseudoterrestris]